MSVRDTVPFRILSVNQQPYKGKAGKPDGIMYKAQCVLERDGVTKIGELFLPRDLVDTPPGMYLGEYALDSDYSKEVKPVVVGLHPVPETALRSSAPVVRGSAPAESSPVVKA